MDKPLKTKQNILIIGGGIIGLACAHYLIRDGHKVTILEREKIGGAASHGNCGLLCFSDLIPLCAPGTIVQELVKSIKGISPLYIKPRMDPALFIWLSRFALNCNKGRMDRAAAAKYAFLTYSARLFDRLRGQFSMDCDLEKKGLLMVYKNKKGFDAYGQTDKYLRPYGMGARKISREELLHMEPSLKEDIAGGWLNPADGSLRPDMLITSWKIHLRQKGVILKEHCPVTGFIHSGPRSTITGVRTDQGEFKADAFILAAGAWTPLTMKQLRLSIPVQPGKGYSITMERPHLIPSRPCSFSERKVVATPWKNGYRLGGTMEFSGYDNGFTKGRLSKIIAGAGEYLKHPMGHPVVEEWTGLRPMCSDDMPVIDRAPGRDNLIVATGHGMLGLTLAPGTGKIASDMIAGRTPDIDVAPFSMTRFI
ncbi:MAG TPA: amino acid dehydrogenase [Desulfobacteraceae bacterium]|nr:amino acid dehydrogenase [Desulfobacteraceae bacterium]